MVDVAIVKKDVNNNNDDDNGNKSVGTELSRSHFFDNFKVSKTYFKNNIWIIGLLHVFL